MGNRWIGLKGWLTVSALLLLAAGASLGFLAANYLGFDRDGDEAFAEPQPDPGLVVRVENPMVYDHLGLSPAQRIQADRILSEHFQKLKRLRGEWDALGTKVESDLLALLDADQREKMRGVVREIKLTEVAGKVNGRLAVFKRELKLADLQEEQLYSVLISDQLARDEYFRSLPPPYAPGARVNRDEIGKTLARLQKELQDKVKPFLSDEQFAKFKDIEKRRPPWWGPGPRGIHRPGGGDGKAEPKPPPGPGPGPGPEPRPESLPASPAAPPPGPAPAMPAIPPPGP